MKTIDVVNEILDIEVSESMERMSELYENWSYMCIYNGTIENHFAIEYTLEYSSVRTFRTLQSAFDVSGNEVFWHKNMNFNDAELPANDEIPF
jgi:hypothetical protein